MYVLQLDEKSFCPTCNRQVDLLTPDWPKRGQPMFYICWPCQKVAQAGVGEVYREGEKHGS